MHRLSRRTGSKIFLMGCLAFAGTMSSAVAQSDTEVVTLDRDLVRLAPPGNEAQVANYMPVVLCAHADTVGVERDLWSVDPYAGVIRGDFLYGRGSFDDKGGIVATG